MRKTNENQLGLFNEGTVEGPSVLGSRRKGGSSRRSMAPVEVWEAPPPACEPFKSPNPCTCGHDRIAHFHDRGTDERAEFGSCLGCYYRKELRNGKTIPIWPCRHFTPYLADEAEVDAADNC